MRAVPTSAPIAPQNTPLLGLASRSLALELAGTGSDGQCGVPGSLCDWIHSGKDDNIMDNNPLQLIGAVA